jgi:uncharacterized protein involved in exopolysaccharide biosynthesis
VLADAAASENLPRDPIEVRGHIHHMSRESDSILDPAEQLGTEYAKVRPKADVNMLELLVTLTRRKSTIIKTTLITTLVVAAISLLLPVRYTARTLIMPPQQSQSLANIMMGQLNMLAGFAGREIAVKNGVDLYAAMLDSESVENGLIQKFQLMSVYRTKTQEDTRKALRKRTTIKPLLKEGLIQVFVDDRDPKRAADMANGYVDELHALNQRLALTENSQRRVFFEDQLLQAKENLIKAEQTMKQTQEKTGLLQLDSQARIIIQSVASLRGGIAAKEVQLQAMRSFATGENPDLVLAEKQLAAMRVQLAKALHSQNVQEGDPELPTSKVPEAGVAYIRAYRDLRYYEAIYEIISKQYEAAKLDEAKSASFAQVVDRAVVPERKSFPHRLLMTIGAFFAGILLGCALVIVQEAYRRFISNPANREQVNLLKSYVIHKRF